MKFKIENVSLDVSSDRVTVHLPDEDKALKLSVEASNEIKNKIGATLMTQLMSREELAASRVETREGHGLGGSAEAMEDIWAKRRADFTQTGECIYGDKQKAVKGFKLCRGHLNRVRNGQANKK